MVHGQVSRFLPALWRNASRRLNWRGGSLDQRLVSPAPGDFLCGRPTCADRERRRCSVFYPLALSELSAVRIPARQQSASLTPTGAARLRHTRVAWSWWHWLLNVHLLFTSVVGVCVGACFCVRLCMCVCRFVCVQKHGDMCVCECSESDVVESCSYCNIHRLGWFKSVYRR